MSTYNCLFCQKICIFDLRKTNKYCSNKCQTDFQSSKKLLEWKDTSISSRAAGCPGWLKRYILEKQDNSCFECKIKDWNNKPIIFELEHRDGNSDNNTEENLCCLCPNCHSQTSTYKGANRGKGRHNRRERYAAGKSF